MAESKSEEINRITERLDVTTEELREMAHKLRLAARGAVTRLGSSSNEFLDELVKAGEKLDKERRKAEKKSARGGDQPRKTVEEARQRLAGYLGLPTQDEVEKLNKKLNTLQRKVRKLEKETTA